MRRFSADYLRETRRGMWDDSRDALADLDLGSRDRVLDVGCGTGELSRVLAAETAGEVVGTDADPDLLAVAREHVPVVAADALRLPFDDGSFDLVVCQALLINLPDPERAVREFARVSSDLVAAVEPDNGAVTVDSTVDAEERLAARARESYVSGVGTDVTLGGEATHDLFESVGLSDVRTRRYEHATAIEPPYSAADLEAAKRKASGSGLAANEPELRRVLSPEAYDELRAAWREMGREAIEAMREGTYRRVETVPFYATVGRV